MWSEVNVSGKVNLSLRVTGIREDGYHCLDMVTVQAACADTIRVEPRNDDLVTCRMVVEGLESVPIIKPEANSAVRAARLMMTEFSLSGMDILITKRIPFGAGFGGSSADAAGVILAVGKIFGLDVWGLRTQARALQCGADVPLLMRGGFLRVLGIGERHIFLGQNPSINLLLAKGKGAVSSAECYRRLDAMGAPTAPCGEDNLRLIEALNGGDIEEAARWMINDLYPAALTLEPDIGNTVRLLKDSGATAVVMTGSGAACAALYATAAQKSAAVKALCSQLEFVL